MKRVALLLVFLFSVVFSFGQSKAMYIKSIEVDSLVLPFGLNKIDFMLCVWDESMLTPRTTRPAVIDYLPSLVEYKKPIKVYGFQNSVWLEVVNSKAFNKLQSIVQFYPFTDENLKGYPDRIRLQNGGNDITLNVYWK
jgi:hypothetical protein